MSVPKHKRFTYFCTGSDVERVAVISEEDMWHHIRLSVVTPSRGCKTPEQLFASTFRYGSRFGEWLDQDWRTA